MSDERVRVQKVFTGESRTEQHHGNEVNINKIMSRYMRTGLLPQRGQEGFYGDFSGAESYQQCLEAVENANSAFMSLPSDVRNRFKNNPQLLLNFLADPNNKEEAISLGILPQPIVDEPAIPEEVPPE